MSTPATPEPTYRSMETLVVHAGRPAAAAGQPLNHPIVPASSFHGGGHFEYARDGAPTTAALEAALGALECGHATVFSSGMGAANAMLDLVPPGAMVVAPTSAYTGVAMRLRESAASGRIRLRLVDVDDTAAVASACSGAFLLWIESPTNPLLQVADLPACIRAAHAAGAQVLVDNTFATPLLQTPLATGADVVMHSVTKALSGHSDLILGALVVPHRQMAEELVLRRTLLGAVPSSFDCFLALRGMRTLALRVERSQQSAQVLASRLENHRAVRRVRYPGFGSLISIETAGGAPAADAVCSGTRVWTFATSLGGVESSLERRRRWQHEGSVVPEDLIRLSVGIENVEDLWEDLEGALNVVLREPESE